MTKIYSTEDREFELATNFSFKYRAKIDDYEDLICKNNQKIGKVGKRLSKNLSKEELELKIANCNETLEQLEKFKQFCIKKGKSGEYYFIIFWEQLHNAKNPCFSFANKINEKKEILEKYLSEKIN